MEVALGNFQSIDPELILTQEETLAKIEEAHQSNGGENIGILLKRFGVKPQQIATRRMETLDLPLRNASIYERNEFFGQRTFQRFQDFYPEGVQPPAHLGHVTCTGDVSPSAPQLLVNEREWSRSTEVTHAYHMGCYAALPAIRLSEGLVASRHKPVDIVHTELCALHLDGSLHSPEQLVVQSLFADGLIKYTVAPPKTFAHGFRVAKILERIVPGSFEDMSWIPSSQSMRMTLSREVPKKIGLHLREFVDELCGVELLKTAQFAVHPGGPRIIDAVKETLELSEEQVSASRSILNSRGNMSSATLPHVWQKMLNDGVRGPVISLAFGPGLTIFGSVYEAY
jgi:predicted naringenin-chalcone synthase